MRHAQVAGVALAVLTAILAIGGMAYTWEISIQQTAGFATDNNRGSRGQ